MRRGLGAAANPSLPSSASELRWAIDEFQGGLRRSGPYRPGGLLGAEPQRQSTGMNDASASQQIDAIVRKTTGWRGERLGRLRALIRGADPGLIEEVKWKKPSRPEGVPVWSHDG